MSFWTVLCRTATDAPNPDKPFGITLDTAAGTWTTGAVVDGIFKTSHGKYQVSPAPSKATFLLMTNSQNLEAELQNMNGATAVGENSIGLALQTGIFFHWTLHSK